MAVLPLQGWKECLGHAAGKRKGRAGDHSPHAMKSNHLILYSALLLQEGVQLFLHDFLEKINFKKKGEGSVV